MKKKVKKWEAISVISLFALTTNTWIIIERISDEKCPMLLKEEKEKNLNQKRKLSKKIEYIFCGEKIDINFAVENDDEELKSVIRAIIRSRTKAEKIVEGLKKMGRINSIYELEEIKGVGRKTVGKLADFFDVSMKKKEEGKQNLINQ